MFVQNAEIKKITLQIMKKLNQKNIEFVMTVK